MQSTLLLTLPLLGLLATVTAVGADSLSASDSIVHITENALPAPDERPAEFTTTAGPPPFTTRPLHVNRTGFVQPKRPRYTSDEELALQRLRPRVEHLVEREDWMDDHFRETVMLKFLRARNLNVNAAEAMMKNALAWRNETDLERLLATDFTRWEKLFPFVLSGVDRGWRPLFYAFISAYDVRKAVIGGQYNTLVQLYDRSFELGFRKALENYVESGKNVALEGFMIIDCTGFNIRQHACLGCLPLYIHIIQSFENYYPQTLYKVILLNAPPAIEVVLRVVRPFMSAHTKKALEVYGPDKGRWGPVLAKYIAPDQLLERFGGTRKLDSSNSMTMG